jgi:hypothetical protein
VIHAARAQAKPGKRVLTGIVMPNIVMANIPLDRALS